MRSLPLVLQAALHLCHVTKPGRHPQDCSQPVWSGIDLVTATQQNEDDGVRVKLAQTAERTAADCASCARPGSASTQVSTALSSVVLLIRGLWVRSPRGPPR